MLKKLISGGQTGADRAGLDAAIAKNFPHGGKCPHGRAAEDGEIPSRYLLDETSSGYAARNRMNVTESDGTVIFYKEKLQGGTALTHRFCLKRKRPHLLVDICLISKHEAVNTIAQFIVTYRVNTLNVAGPRLSKCPEIHMYVQPVLEAVIEHFVKTKGVK